MISVEPRVVHIDVTIYDIPRLIANLRDAAENNGVDSFADIADQIARQTKPPKPVEPQGLGAVVKDFAGQRWTRVGFSHDDKQDWWGEDYGWSEWDRIDAELVLNRGVL